MADVTLMKTAAEQQLEAQWQGAKARLPGPAALRAAAFEQFAATGLPHRRVEEWKYTDLRVLMRDAKPLAAPPDAAAKARAREAGKLLGDIECRRLVFVDGAFVPEMSQLDHLEPGLDHPVPGRRSGGAATRSSTRVSGRFSRPINDVAVALNTAFMGDGAVIRVAPGATLERPLHLVFVASGAKPASIFTRSLVLVERAARAMIVESHEGIGSDYQINTALELDGRRRGPCRSHQDHQRAGERAARLDA